MEFSTEDLTCIETAEHEKSLPFAPSTEWLNSAVVVKDRLRRSAYICTGDDARLPARSLSDGTLRSLALPVLGQ